MTDTQLPKGWRRIEWAERREALSLLPLRVRKGLVVAWAWRVLPIFEAQYPDDNRPRQAIVAAESRLLDPNAAHAAAEAAAEAGYAAADAAWAAADAADSATAAADAADSATATAAADAASDAVWPWLYATYLRAVGPGEFDPAWRTDTAYGVAWGIAADRAFDRMPILADALEDAGCDHAEHLAHMRSGSDEITLADWSIWNLLGWHHE